MCFTIVINDETSFANSCAKLPPREAIGPFLTVFNFFIPHAPLAFTRRLANYVG